MNVRFFAAALLLGLAACQPKPAPAPADPKTFIAALYAKCQASRAFTVLGADAASYFDPATLALMGPDARLTPPGQVGIWQDDPFCAFTEYSDIHPGFVTKSTTATTAVVEADMHPEDKDDPSPSFTYSLTLVNGQWRLSDIARPSLRSIVADAHAATPMAFMQGLYGHYVSEFSTGQWDFSPLNDVAPAYFDPDMLALMSEDQRLNEGQVGALDGDPICGCQDTYRMQVTFTVKSQTASAATIVAHVGGGGPAVVDRTFQLVSTGGRWRIHDISDPDVPSLRALFITSNKEAAAYNASASAAGSS
ncbi:MAG: DUF3828 domain-containing protein [Asticcacaulis sp.]